VKIYAPITKIEDRDDGTLFVAGVASAESVDSQGEVITADAMKAALPDFFKHGSGNLREMHQMVAAGRVDKAEVGDDGKTYIECIVVDPVAVKKVQTGTYKGFSVGGRALNKSDGVISALRLTEISLVDRPANPDSVISVWKADADSDQAPGGGASSEGAGASSPSPEVSPASATSEDAVAKAAEVVIAKYAEGDEVWDASRAIDALSTVIGLIYREGQEGEAAQVEMLRRAATALKEFIASEISETAADHSGERVAMGESNVDILKAGARYSKTTKSMLAKVHGMIRDAEKAMAEMGYEDAEEDDAEKAEGVDDVAKAADALAKAESDLAKVSAERDDLAKRVAELEAQPKPAKAATTAIEKSEDVKDGLASPVSSPDPNDPLSMFKAALSRPILVGGNPISQPSSAN
jgi:hypothetical protein